MDARLTQETTMDFTALYHSIYRNESFTLHAAGCGAIEKERQQHGSSLDSFSADSLEEALDHIIDPELVEMGYDHNEVKVHNCARELCRANKRAQKASDNAAPAAPTAAPRGSKEAIMARTAEQKADAAAKQRARRAAKKAEAAQAQAEPGVKPDSIPEGFKWCPRFKQVLPLSDFARNKASKDGYYSICKAAEAADRKAAAERRKAAAPAPAAPAADGDFNPVPEGSSATVVSRGRKG